MVFIMKKDMWSVLIIFILIVAVVTILFMFLIPVSYPKKSSIGIGKTNVTTPFPDHLINFSNFSKFLSTSLIVPNTTLNGKIYAGYHGFNIYYVNGKDVVNIQQEIFANFSSASQQFINIKNNINNLSQNHNNTIKQVLTNKTINSLSANQIHYNISRNITLIKNLPSNMYGIKTTVGTQNSFMVFTLNGTEICLASLTQFTNTSSLNVNSISPIALLKSAIDTCLSS